MKCPTQGKTDRPCRVTTWKSKTAQRLAKKKNQMHTRPLRERNATSRHLPNFLSFFFVLTQILRILHDEVHIWGASQGPGFMSLFFIFVCFGYLVGDTKRKRGPKRFTEYVCSPYTHIVYLHMCGCFIILIFSWKKCTGCSWSWFFSAGQSLDRTGHCFFFSAQGKGLLIKQNSPNWEKKKKKRKSVSGWRLGCTLHHKGRERH